MRSRDSRRRAPTSPGSIDEATLDRLAETVRDLKTRLDGIEARYLAMKRAEERWHPSLRERDRLLFMNGTGDLARVPRDLARLIAEDRPFDGEIHDAGEALEFERDGEVLAEVPKIALEPAPRAAA